MLDKQSPPSIGKGVRDALAHVDSAFNGFRLDSTVSREGSLREILAKSGIYDTGSSVLPYDKQKVSWPDVGSLPSQLCAGLPEAENSMLSNWQSHLLETQDDEQPAPPQSTPIVLYCDKHLFHSPTSYSQFLQGLHLANMLGLSGKVSQGAGVLRVFFVAKKDGSLRLIFDTRFLNTKFPDPPKTSLPTAAAFSSIEVQTEQTLLSASADVRNAFYVLQVPESLSQEFTLPAIKCKYIPHFIHIPGILPNDYVCPCLRVLPMVWNWGLHFC